MNENSEEVAILFRKFTETEINSVNPTEIQKHYNKNLIPAFEPENHYLQAEELNKIVETLDLNSKIVKVLMQQTNQLVDYNALDNIESDKNFTYDQTTPSKEWDILHNLNKKPSVTVTDSANTVVEGRVVINDGVRLLIEFNAPFTGSAILN